MLNHEGELKLKTVKQIYDFLNLIAPFDSAMEFDNCGILVGDPHFKVNRVLLSLDITSEVCDEAKKLGAELIISHHPVIFKPLKNIMFNTTVHKLIRYNLSAICAHTNLDMAENGVNFHLAKTLELKNLKPLSYFRTYSLGFIGDLKLEMTSKEFAFFVKNRLGCDGIRYTESTKKITKVAVCSGSGGDLVNDAINGNADAFVTGEIKHSQILEANKFDITVVDAGHFKTENLILYPLSTTLKEKFTDVEFHVSDVFTDKVKYL